MNHTIIGIELVEPWSAEMLAHARGVRSIKIDVSIHLLEQRANRSISEMTETRVSFLSCHGILSNLLMCFSVLSPPPGFRFNLYKCIRSSTVCRCCALSLAY